MIKIAVITSTRAEYGSLKWVMKEIEASPDFQLQIIATGAHLMKEQGHTIDEILQDGFRVDKEVNAGIDTTSPFTIAESMGRLAQMMSNALEELNPDFVIILGDRYELLPICNSAFIMRIPMIHISGGDVTQGAIDDGIRNAITMLAEYHFPSTVESKANIVRMRGSDKNVWDVGVPELDLLTREQLMTRAELAENLNIDIDKEWIMFTYHAETVSSLEHNLSTVRSVLKVLERMDNCQVVATYSNADFGGKYINELLHKKELYSMDWLRVVPSLGHKRYLSFMKQVKFVIGNSSSGITEAPMLHIPSINIGDRQKGRYQCSNVIQCDYKYDSIFAAVSKGMAMTQFDDDLYHWGDGHASEKIVKILSETIRR